ncbi:thioredoxin domain-containing protein [Gordonia sp. HY002]|uniref:thioredoxin domain-containing protein n=1 Tax=Gordonia zhenghanii TaxID=2911516 RepID=UPI001EF0A4D5|nr:thioredoxin domain-containing protein [Gordonia zhenghanii]MCF8570345.1 thioredoxin domain-containing protein [Gordonia zhenghanii]MCF8607138.1 thioredoxin domain-containing protein [Gordonia zhenghanii]
MANRLQQSNSPYLRQHADNPVDWQEWGDEAFAQARERDVPILLSVGYAACHWCHVMAHETFEDPDLAVQMNAGFVCVKVDREERPDIDSIYMAATVAMTGQGGWPMTCFLTPDGDPFYCGTYFPPRSRNGQPGFAELLDAVYGTWTTRRDEVEVAGSKITEHLRATAQTLPDGPQLDVQLLADATAAVLADEDRAHAGFGRAPKFPPSALLEGLLRSTEYTSDDTALDAATRTLDAMARGGIYDQLAGGFARYAVDEQWVVPHFEKMLYDNALLLRAYAHHARLAGDALSLRVTAETVAFLDDYLWTGRGYASSLDADTEGVEGLTYVWRPDELVEILGDDAGWAAELFAVTDAGTFEQGSSTLQLPRDPDDAARYESVRARLSAARAQRPQPDRDDKVVTGWNGFAITALAEAGATLDRPEWTDRAREIATGLLDVHLVDGDLHRSSLDGVVGTPLGALEDYAALTTALITLHSVTGEQRWRTAGLDILDRAIEVFADTEETGAWFDAYPGGLLLRPRDPVDGATPAGASLIAEALVASTAVADVDAQQRYADLADATLARAGIILAKAPRSAGHWLTVAQAYVAGPVQVAVAQAPDSDGDMAAQLRQRVPGGVLVIAGDQDSGPLLTDRGPVPTGGRLRDAAYVCRGRVCDLPVTTVDAARV